MRGVISRQGAFVCLIVAAAMTVSCSNKGREAVYEVKGKVLHNGKPAEGAMVILHKIGADEKRGLMPFGRTGSDGTFQITSYTANDGAPEGEYIVTLVWPTAPTKQSGMEEGPDRLKGRLADLKTSKWRITVEKKSLMIEPLKID